ncbi:MAG: hypothetical protein V3V03_03230 [Hyphomonadaceae bacterium]
MTFLKPALAAVLLALPLLSACTVARATGTVAAAPFKAAWFAGKYTGKGIWYAGKGVYYVGRVPVDITNAALDTTSKFLTVTTQVVDLAGKIIIITKVIETGALEAELAALSTMTNLVSISVDVAT